MANRFDPQTGLTAGLTVKEQIEKALDEGVFDDATTFVIGLCSSKTYRTWGGGRVWDQMALSTAVADYVAGLQK